MCFGQSSVEILTDQPLSGRGEAMLLALAKVAGIEPTSVYTGTKPVVILYGVGLKQRMQIKQRHRGHVVMLDMGYWNREGDDLRISIDSFHPTAEQIEATPPEPRRHLELGNVADSAGPIMLVGLGRKSCAMYGLMPLQWERAKLASLRMRFPKRQIVWRPKGRIPERFMGLPLRHGMEIEDALIGCSLVVCRHSNVAVNACIAGVPVECEDGAAFALYANNRKPTSEQRLDFLSRLTHWNYSPAEAPAAWEHIKRMLQ